MTVCSGPGGILFRRQFPILARHGIWNFFHGPDRAPTRVGCRINNTECSNRRVLCPKATRRVQNRRATIDEKVKFVAAISASESHDMLFAELP
jgi:hypothetical protein